MFMDIHYNTYVHMYVIYRWIIHWLCQGTRNLAAAVRCLTEMLEESSTNTGVYIICSGLPDQDEVGRSQWYILRVVCTCVVFIL